MKDFLLFHRMVLPVIIQIMFWMSTFFFVVLAIVDFVHGIVPQGLACLFLGPLASRMIAEYTIIFFRMNDTLTEIKNKLVSHKI